MMASCVAIPVLSRPSRRVTQVQSAVSSGAVGCRPAARATRSAVTVARDMDSAGAERGDGDRMTQTRRAMLTGAASLAASLCSQLPEAHAVDAPVVTDRVYLDVAVDNKILGRIVIGLYGEASPVGAQRFKDLASNLQGVGYRRSTFDKIDEAYIRNEGLRSFEGYGAGAVPIAGGDDPTVLLKELALSSLSNLAAGDVALVVTRDSSADPAPKERLMSINGKLVSVSDPPPPPPNGTGFTILTQPSPELDATNLVVGRVLEGMSVLQKMSQLPTTRANTDSPFFKTAKTIGDSRATVAEKGFGRPLGIKVTVKASNLLSADN